MAYLTVTDIEDRITNADLIRLTDETGSGRIDEGKIETAITDAEAEVNSYCGRHYTVPFADPVPAMITKVCKDIAVYNVYSLKNAADEDCKERYKQAVSFLDKAGKGLIDLGTDSPTEVDDGGPESIKAADDKIFTMDTMEGF